MTQDYLGNPLSTADAAVIAAVDAFTTGMLTYDARASKVIKAAVQSDAPILSAYAAALMMMSETPQGPARAQPFLAKAEAPSAHPREQAAAAFVRAWTERDEGAAMAIAAEALTQWPRDLMLLKLHDYLAFNAGDHPAMLRTTLAAAAACPEVPQVHGMLAFAYEESHQMRRAESAARRALDSGAADPWAEHALAHVMLTEGRVAEGADFLEAAAPGWATVNSFMSGHNWWHFALFALSQGREDAVLSAYDDHVWAGDHDYSQDQIGAVSLLARLELAGVDVGARWTEVADHIAARGPDVEQPFLALQYLIALARDGRAEAEPLLDAIRRRAAEAPPYGRPVWIDAGIPIAEGIAALLIKGDPAAALPFFDQGLPHLQRIGGSHAQRDLFHQLRLDALLRAGRLEAAEQVLQARLAFDPHGVPLNRTLKDVRARLAH